MSSREIDQSISFLQKSRRAHLRFTVSLPVTVRLNGKPLDGQVQNLSLGGMFLVFPGDTVPGDRLECELALPGVAPATIPVEVRWFVPRGAGTTACGVKFLSLPGRHLKAIVELSSDANLR